MKFGGFVHLVKSMKNIKFEVKGSNGSGDMGHQKWVDFWVTIIHLFTFLLITPPFLKSESRVVHRWKAL